MSTKESLPFGIDSSSSVGCVIVKSSLRCPLVTQDTNTTIPPPSFREEGHGRVGSTIVRTQGWTRTSSCDPVFRVCH